MAIKRDFAGWWDVIAAAVPDNTIVGKALDGNYTGAAQAAGGAIGYEFNKATTAPAVQPTAGGVPYYLQRPFEPGGFVEQNQKALVFGAVGLGALLLFMQMKKGRR